MEKLCVGLLFFLIACSQPPPDEGEHAYTQPNILFLFADDWSYPHAGAYGDPVVRTPTFDRLADEGALFHNAYCAAPSCSPSRAAVLTGRYPHQNASAGNLWSVFPDDLPNYMSILAENGYFTGKTRKGWGPGDFRKGGYEHNPAGKDFDSFRSFYEQKPDGQPFSFWFSSYDPHRAYVANTGIQAGMAIDDVVVPGFLPDVPCVRNDILDYYYEVERFDRECGRIIRMLEEAGELDNTLIVMTSDNGMPFPRAKANLYDYGTRMPFAVRWPTKVQEGSSYHSFINFVDLAPTFLEAAGLQPPSEMTGKSLLPLFTGAESGAEQVFLERERHANVRKGNLSYPMRAVRDDDFLYIRNFMPDRWPAGDSVVHQSVGQWGDVDNSITKFLIMQAQGSNEPIDYFDLSFGKRPGEELYKLSNDPFQLENLAERPEFQRVKQDMNASLMMWMQETGDLRFSNPETIYWDTVEYTPNYQHHNAHWQEAIQNYRIVKNPGGSGVACDVGEVGF